jgi:AcrR family transcriptional regulator
MKFQAKRWCLIFSWNCFKDIAEQLRWTMEAVISRACPDRQLTGIRILLDREGWQRVADAANEEFEGYYEEQEDARRRVERTGESLFRAGALLLAFELPIKDGLRVGPELVMSRVRGRLRMIPYPVRVSKVFEDEVCLQILDEANRADISVPSFHRAYGKKFNMGRAAIRRRFQKLVKYGWLRIISQETGGSRRGGTEHFYRATGPAVYDEDESGPWANVPDALADSDDWRTFMQLSDWAKAAMVAGTIAAHDETCLTWSILYLDRIGWERVVAGLERFHALVLREYELAETRMAESGDEPMAVVIGLGALETPKPIKEP